ncbi:MAG TPA: alcohol dehydrogenase catalytic domain-containing protein [Streptosporangiaceae bacterium]|nr:alcohol dehydrogenase catalytic domain-containing protein [Streptosporangiaceae bacterium]
MADAGERALVLERPREFRLRALASRPPAAGEVLVRPQFVGLCGTDLHIAAGDHPRARLPLVLGHEIVGTADAGRWAGRTVVVDPTIACGSCAACLRGDQHVCQQLRLIGIDRDGGLCRGVFVAESKLHPVPAELPTMVAALAEPLAVAVHAASRAGPYLGATVVVLGAGPIGLLIALVVRAAGAHQLVLAEPIAARRESARKLDFETVPEPDMLAAALKGEPADIVFDAAAAPATARQATRLLRPRGTIVVAGVFGHPVAVDLQTVTFAELNVVGTRVYQPHDLATALRLLASGSVDVTGLISDVVELQDVPDALLRLSRGQALKVLVRCDSQS